MNPLGAVLAGVGVGVLLAWGFLGPEVAAVAGLLGSAGLAGLGIRSLARVQGELAQVTGRSSRLLASREELLLAVSHELRTPLMRLRFATDQLVDEDDPGVRAAQGERVQRDIDELDALVEDLLAWGRLESDALQKVEVKVASLFGRLVEDATRERADVSVTVREVAAEVVVGDRKLLNRAVGNLLSNALRYGGGRVELGCERREGELWLVVDDDGPGIPEVDRERVLEPFVRLDPSRSTDLGGTGLGMSLVARIAAAHGGRLALLDSPLGGLRAAVVIRS